MQLSVFLAAPAVAMAAAVSGTEPLRIPIADIISRNFTLQANNPLMPVFQKWIAENEDLDFMSGAVPPPDNLKVIHCEASGCLWESSVSLSPELVEALGKQQEARGIIGARANANSGIVNTHFKTYIKGTNGGLEHYTNWNLHCGRLEYRGTGMVLDSEIARTNSANDITTKVFCHEYRAPRHQYVLQQDYGCSYFGNKCCVKSNKATVTGATMTRTSWECYKWQNASPACQG